MRTKIGLIALVLFALAAYFTFWSPPATGAQTWTAACIRIALVLAAAWLALPQLRDAPRWVVITAALLCLVLARWPRYFLLVLLVAVVFALFKPRMSNR